MVPGERCGGSVLFFPVENFLGSAKMVELSIVLSLRKERLFSS
jgi:hypothetical protein